jgi:hypothetical protein
MFASSITSWTFWCYVDEDHLCFCFRREDSKSWVYDLMAKYRSAGLSFYRQSFWSRNLEIESGSVETLIAGLCLKR